MDGKRPITFVAGGSLGDVQPLVAIGRGLSAAGRTARLAGHRRFAELAESNGMEFVDLPDSGDPVEVKKYFVAQGTGRIATVMQTIRRRGPPPRSLRHLLESCRGSAALVVTSFSGQASHAAEALGIPVFCAALHPIYPTGEFSSPFAPADLLRLPQSFALNWLSHWGMAALAWEMDRGWVNEWRREMGLPRVTRRGFLHYLRARGDRVLFGFSPSVVRRPADWPDDLEITGYWRLKAPPWSPPADLQRFLDAGDPPVFIGFGSTIDAQPEALERIVLDAARSTGRRTLIGRGYAQFASIKPDTQLHIIDEAPFAWLYPRVSVAVHHGGAGTCAEALHAGVPSVVIPFFGEQRFWAGRLALLGAAPPPIPRARLDARSLGAAIERAAGDAVMRGRSEELRGQLAREDGVARAVEIILSGVD